VEVDPLDYIRQILDNFKPVMFFPAIIVLLIVLFFVYYFMVSRPLPGTTQWIDNTVNRPRLSFLTTRHRMEKGDIVPLAVITAVFAFLAFFRLGDTTAPQSFLHFSKESKPVVIELDRPEEISSVMFYTGWGTGYYRLEFSADGSKWIEQSPVDEDDPETSPVYAMDQKYSHLFKWRYAVLNTDNPAVKYIRITAETTPIELGELALYGPAGELIPYSRISAPNSAELFDEQELIPDAPSYMNSMYFDEIYHGRTAFEHLRMLRPYERTHPPLGKVIISASISLLGMTPFAWRFPGALFGVIMLIVLYIFIKNMFGKTMLAVCGTLLLGFDFMRFVQTRIATIDTYGVFFILIAYFFMYRYITADADAPFRKSLAPLALSGVAFGLGCASKWIGVYAGAGLAVIYVISLAMRSINYSNKNRSGFGMYLMKTLLFSLLFFVVVPVVIYCLSYIPYGYADGMTIRNGMLWDPDYYELIWRNQTYMFNYHSDSVVSATHPYSSFWWQWILDARPILYYSSTVNGIKSVFAAFGNPVVWWGGIVAMLAMGVRVFTHRDAKALFILIGFLSQFLPWLPVTRILFIYHYFPSTIFLVLALVHVFNTMLDSGRKHCKLVICCYTGFAGLLFVIFYPVLTGVPAPFKSYSSLIRWFPGHWPF